MLVITRGYTQIDLGSIVPQVSMVQISTMSPSNTLKKSHVALLKINKINISASENQFKPPFHHWFAA